MEWTVRKQRLLLLVPWIAVKVTPAIAVVFKQCHCRDDAKSKLHKGQCMSQMETALFGSSGSRLQLRNTETISDRTLTL